MEAFETDVSGGNTMPKQNDIERHGLVFVSGALYARCLHEVDRWKSSEHQDG